MTSKEVKIILKCPTVFLKIYSHFAKFLGFFHFSLYETRVICEFVCHGRHGPGTRDPVSLVPLVASMIVFALKCWSIGCGLLATLLASAKNIVSLKYHFWYF